MFANGIRKVFEEKSIVPPGDHGRVVVGPAKASCRFGVFTVGAEHLNVVYADGRGKLSVVVIYVGKGFTGVMNGILCGGLEGDKEEEEDLPPTPLPGERGYDAFLQRHYCSENAF